MPIVVCLRNHLGKILLTIARKPRWRCRLEMIHCLSGFFFYSTNANNISSSKPELPARLPPIFAVVVVVIIVVVVVNFVVAVKCVVGAVGPVDIVTVVVADTHVVAVVAIAIKVVVVLSFGTDLS